MNTPTTNKVKRDDLHAVESFVPADFARELESALRQLLAVITSHECRSDNCDRTEDVHCLCLDRAVVNATDALEHSAFIKS